jgi:crotonobetainyl-CoA:carnitine CoA-transferase CaiB-like acyl-CoA transferase
VAKPLEGVKVVELSMWAFVPAAAGILADMGAEVIKIEPPEGDAARGLVVAGLPGGVEASAFMFEIFNRGKRSIGLDLRTEQGLALLHRLLEDADVFVTNLLPASRQRLKIDMEDLRSRHPGLIYAIGSGMGSRGPDAEKGGYDAITYWGRAGITSAVTPQSEAYPLSMPGPAFGDGTSGAVLAGGIAAAIAQKARTGKVSVVDASLLGVGMWAMQPGIVCSTLMDRPELPLPSRFTTPNPLSSSYRTRDGRVIVLCMLQSQRYWPGFCETIGRPELIHDPRFDTAEQRTANLAECLKVLDEVFITKTLAEWKDILARQEGPWDVIQKAGELVDDPAAVANGYVQQVDYGGGRRLAMVSAPVQFDGEPLKAGPAPAFGAHADELLAELGLSEDEIIDLKIAGVVH